MVRPDPVNGLRRRLVLLHLPAVVVSAVLLHTSVWPVNGLTILAAAALVGAVVLMTRDVQATERVAAEVPAEAVL